MIRAANDAMGTPDFDSNGSDNVRDDAGPPTPATYAPSYFSASYHTIVDGLARTWDRIAIMGCLLQFWCGFLVGFFCCALASSTSCEASWFGTFGEYLWAYKVSRWEAKNLFSNLDVLSTGGLQILAAWLGGLISGPIGPVLVSGIAMAWLNAPGNSSGQMQQLQQIQAITAQQQQRMMLMNGSATAMHSNSPVLQAPPDPTMQMLAAPGPSTAVPMTTPNLLLPQGPAPLPGLPSVAPYQQLNALHALAGLRGGVPQGHRRKKHLSRVKAFQRLAGALQGGMHPGQGHSGFDLGGLGNPDTTSSSSGAASSSSGTGHRPGQSASGITAQQALELHRRLLAAQQAGTRGGP